MRIVDILPMLASAVAAMTPLLFAASGGLLSELTGTLNIALEGLITIGAFFGAIAAAASNNLFIGLIAGLAASTLIAFIFGAVTLRLKANIFITGLATNIMASGLTIVLSQKYFATKGVLALRLPAIFACTTGLANLPLIGPLVFSQNILTQCSWIFMAFVWILVYRTPAGMRLRATGANANAIAALGLHPDMYRLIAISLSGAACGLAGAYMAFQLSAYVPNISSGRGWIALVAIYLGGKRIGGIFAACFIFALAEAFSNYAQGFLRVPSDFILAIPYIVTLAALVLGTAIKQISPHKSE